jgi:predicted kinase
LGEVLGRLAIGGQEVRALHQPSGPLGSEGGRSVASLAAHLVAYLHVSWTQSTAVLLRTMPDMVEPVLVVMAGRPGTGKTTLAREVARRMGAGLIRTDVIATALIRSGLTQDPASAGTVAYDIARDLAMSTLGVGTPVVIDGVNATHRRRRQWTMLSATMEVPVHFLEAHLPDAAEHRRRVESRVPDFQGLVVPTWQQVVEQPYDPWDDRGDGPRLLVDTSDLHSALAAAVEYATARSHSRG